MKALYRKNNMLVNFKVKFTHYKSSMTAFPGYLVYTAKFNLN